MKAFHHVLVGLILVAFLLLDFHPVSALAYVMHMTGGNESSAL